MALISSIDGPNRRIYLGIDSTSVDLQPMDIYKEMRSLRKSDEDLRKYDVFLSGKGYISKGGGTFTPRYVLCLLGTRIVPYDGNHTLTVIGEIITDEETSGIECFDKTLLTPGVLVDIDYQPPQVEIIEVGSSPADIADAVWDEETSGHNIPNTFGGEIATKSDIKAVSATDHVQALSGTIIYGTLQSGTYLSTQVKDNVYWQIGEDAVDGLTVELTFNIPSADHNAGVISTFGRYIGQPAISHWMELWAWNYEASTWELLQEVFMPGGNTSDSLYEHEYYERHIDRDNNNEVLVRLIHHTSAYNASHSLYIDYMEASSIEVLTAEIIADAVWDEDVAPHVTVNSAATALKATTYEASISLDTVNGFAGTGWPIGTNFKPSNNLTDALTIMGYGNVNRLLLHSDITVGATQDVSGLIIETMGLMGTTITFTAGARADRTALRYLNVEGEIYAGDEMLIENCSILTLSNFRGVMNNVAFGQGAEISFDTWATIIQGTAGGDTLNEVEFNLNAASINIAQWTGPLKLIGKTGTDRTVVNCNSGNIIIDSTCVAGKIQLLGVGLLEADNSGAGCQVDTDGFITIEQIARTVWSQEEARRLLGLMHENVFIDQPNYDAFGNLDSARVRIYSDAGSVGTDNNVISTYTITAPSVAPGQFSTWKQVKI